jgi:hypothetical protein
MPTFEACADLPSPWTRKIVHFTGGLTGVGLGPQAKHLLVVSHAGRGVIDLSTGERVARDSQEIPDSEFQEDPFAVGGIGPLAGVQVSCAGLWGGSLPNKCPDGWRVDGTVLHSPSGRQHSLPPADADIRAVGFTPKGEILMYATAASLSLYYRVT